MVGVTLMRSAEMRSVATDFTRFTAAFENFRGKYSALPGDMKNAYAFWGAAAGCTNTVVATIGDTGCNGNGDGQISYWYTDGARAWWMMQQAGYLEGSVGAGPISTTLVPGGNEPASKVNGGGYAIGWVLVSSWLGWGTYNEYGHWIIVGSQNIAVASGPGFPLFSPENAASLDSKLDDGMPGTGKVMGGDGILNATMPVTYASCVSAHSATGTYLVSNSNITCVMAFDMP